MRVLHTSDLHGKYKRLLAVTEPFDVWVDTGDFFDNHGRTSRTGFRIDAAFEAQWQTRWWELGTAARCDGVLGELGEGGVAGGVGVEELDDCVDASRLLLTRAPSGRPGRRGHVLQPAIPRQRRQRDRVPGIVP